MIDRERMTATFLDLVRIDSHSREEREVAEHLVRALTQIGCEVRVDDAGAKAGGNTGNVIGRLPGTSAGAAPLLLSSHMDTVPPGKGVKPVREAGRICTDGTTVLGGDDKSGLAIILETLRTVAERGLAHGDVEFALTICEEVGLLGAKYLDPSAFRARRGLVLDATESTLLYTRSPSSDHFEFTVHGLEAHAGMAPETGISAVAVAARAIAAMPLGRIDPETTANVVIADGSGPTNVVPNRCIVRGEARSLSDERLDQTTAGIRRAFQDAAAAATATVDGRLHRAWVEERCERDYHSMAVPDDAPIVTLLMRAAGSAGAKLATASIGGGSDANVFNRHGIQSAVIGTGMRAIHTVNEWLDLADFYACADVVLSTVTLMASDGR